MCPLLGVSAQGGSTVDISDKDDSVEGLDREKHNTGDPWFPCMLNLNNFHALVALLCDPP